MTPSDLAGVEIVSSALEVVARPAEVVEVAVLALRHEGVLAPVTVERLERLMHQFARFVERGHRVGCLQDVRPDMVTSYLVAPTGTGVAPGVSLQHFRRLAVRVLFRTARQLNLATGDPTLDIGLPSRVAAVFRPLEDDEMDLCRASALGGSTRRAAIWALSEATARTGELAAITGPDIDLDGGRVWIAGTPRTAARWGHLTTWSVRQLSRHLAQARTETSAPVVAGGRRTTLPQSSAVRMVSAILVRAGLDSTCGVRPTSIAGWVGRTLFEETGRLDLVAGRLGMRSLDRTARLIGWDWHDSGG